MTNLIVWQKWVDPFGGDDDIINEKNEPEFYDDNYNTIEDETDKEEKDILKKGKVQGIRVMATPMGIIPVNENTASGKIFNFWVGHTNFNITGRVAQIIEETDGQIEMELVETPQQEETSRS